MKIRYVAIFLIIVIPVLISESVAQEITKSKPVLGVRFTSNYSTILTRKTSLNFRILSSVPSVFVEFNEHMDFHAGVVYARLLNPHWVDQSSFETEAMGLTLGYRLITMDHIKNLRLTGQADVSVTKVGFKQTNSHSQEGVRKELLWVYSLSMGADYQLNNKFHLSAGCSLSLPFPYRSHLDKIIPSLFMGLDYRFGIQKKK